MFEETDSLDIHWDALWRRQHVLHSLWAAIA